MKKSMKMLVRGISLALVLSLVLSVTAFAEKVTNTYTPTQSDGTAATQYSNDISGLYYMVEGGATNIVEGSPSFGFKFGSNVGTGGATYKETDGGVIITLPLDKMSLDGVESENVTKATLTLPVYTSAAITNPNNYLWLFEVGADEYKKIVDEKASAFYDVDESGAYTANKYAPYTLKKAYEFTGDSDTCPAGIYADSINQSIYPDAKTNNVAKETYATITVDITALIQAGDLTDARYLLLQKNRATVTTSNNVKNSIYFPFYNASYYPELTIGYEETQSATGATGVASHKSLLDDEQTVTIQSGYGYTITFNGEVDSTTLTEETVLVKDSEDNVIDLDGVAGNNCLTYDDATNTLTIPLPTSTTNKTETKWLTAGETYTVTLTTDIKDTAGNSVFNTDNTEVKFTMENLTYYVTETSFRTNTSASNRFAALNEGADAAKIGQTIYAYGYVQNYTAEEIPLLGIIAVYDDKGTLLQCGVMNTKKAAANMMSDTVNPSITLTQDLKEGYVIKSFIWHRNALNPFLNTSADLNTGGSKTAMTEIVVGAAATE